MPAEPITCRASYYEAVFNYASSLVELEKPLVFGILNFKMKRKNLLHIFIILSAPFILRAQSDTLMPQTYRGATFGVRAGITSSKLRPRYWNLF